MNNIVHKYIRGKTAVKLAESIEDAIRQGKLQPGRKLPTIRELARARRVSPATAASAYHALHLRGVISAQGRRGTWVSHRRIHGPSCAVAVPHGIRDLSDGNPDASLLPPFGKFLSQIDGSPRLYGEPCTDDALAKLLSDELGQSGVRGGEICMVHGAMDAIERVVVEHLRAGDRVAVEDPGFGNIFDLLMSHGLSLVPIKIDQEGLLPDDLDRACRQGVKALIVTPRAQNPTGAALTEQRAKDLRRVLRRYPDVLLIEDDHAALITDAPLFVLHNDSRRHWVYIRSFAKALNPDLRMAAMIGDERTVRLVQDRMFVGCRWVSHILQRLAHALLSDEQVRAHLRKVTEIYHRRREALRSALAEQGLEMLGRSGFNGWLPVPAETPVIQGLLQAGWMVAPGERFRINSPPGIRVTTASLPPGDAAELALALGSALNRRAAASLV